MAKLIFTLPEIIEIVKINVPLPSQIESATAKGDKIFLRINPGSFIPSFNTTLTFNKFQDGKIFLLLETNKFLDLIAKIFKRDLTDWVSIDLPEIIIEVNKFLSENIKSLQIAKIECTDQDFILYT